MSEHRLHRIPHRIGDALERRFPIPHVTFQLTYGKAIPPQPVRVRCTFPADVGHNSLDSGVQKQFRKSLSPVILVTVDLL